MHVCHLLETALDAHWPQTGSHPVDIRRISTGGIYDFPAQDKVFQTKYDGRDSLYFKVKRITSIPRDSWQSLATASQANPGPLKGQTDEKFNFNG